jgi:uncharacterized protein (UPF0276 family)
MGTTPAQAVDPIPACAGIGFRSPHFRELSTRAPRVGWLEVHSENYFAPGGAHLDQLARLRERYPLSLHGVGLSLGSVDPLNLVHLRRLKRLTERYAPALVSEHLSWSSVNGRYLNDLLPLPYTEEALRHVIARVQYVQDYLGRRILIENVSSYLRFRGAEMSEWTFVGEVARRSGCGILLDVNNVYVSACNHGDCALEYIDAIPGALVEEFHLAGHALVERDGRWLRIDTHDARVCDAVWALFAHALERIGPRPTLIEWDADLPALDVLIGEAGTADRYLAGDVDEPGSGGRCHDLAA